MAIRLAESDEEIRACKPVLQQLRPQLEEDSPAGFVERVRSLERGGYRLAFLAEDGRPRCVAGFRSGESLAWGRFLYVDDLVTEPAARSRGHGRALLHWLLERARAEGLDALHLDSGVGRLDAHRFYEREGLERSAFHFRRRL